MAKEGAPRPQEKTSKISYENIAWHPDISERNKMVVKGLLEIGEPTSKRFVMPGTKEKPFRVQPPTKYTVDGVEVFHNPVLDFYQAHVDGVPATPVPFQESDNAEKILEKIEKDVFNLKNHPDRKKPKA